MEKERKKIRELRDVSKYLPVLLVVIGTIRCGMRALGREVSHLHMLWCGIILLFGWLLNNLFGLCKLHIFCIFYVAITFFLLREVKEQELYIGLTLIGIALIVSLIIRARRDCHE